MAKNKLKNPVIQCEEIRLSRGLVLRRMTRRICGRLWRFLARAMIPGLFSMTVAAGTLTPPPNTALPQGGTVAAGTAAITQPSPTGMVINQGTNQAVINWNSFNVGQDASVRFNQPGAGSSTLNRVLSSDPSQIYGKMSANGQIYVVNPNGIVVGPSGTINAGAVTLTTHRLADADYLAGKNNFTRDGAIGAVDNQGGITAANGGYVALVGATVSNSGTVSAAGGTVVLAAGERVHLPLTASGQITLEVDPATVNALVENVDGGQILATGGQVYLSADATAGLVARTVNTGTLSVSTSTDGNGGHIVVDGGFVALGGDIGADGREGGRIDVTASGVLSLADQVHAKGSAGAGGSVSYHAGTRIIEVDGSRTDVSGATDGGSIRVDAGRMFASSGAYTANGGTGQGGLIDITGADVRLLSVSLDASGAGQGGMVRLGGAFQGGKTPDTTQSYYESFLGRWDNLAAITNASTTFINDASRINVSSSEGTGGTVVIWSDKLTTFLGGVDARGGAGGGAVEISSAMDLRQAALNNVELGNGSLLLDPKNITIGDLATTSNWAYAGVMGFAYASTQESVSDNLEMGDDLGRAVALNAAGDRLAVGVIADDGAGNSTTDAGAVYLFSFSDTNFSGGTLQATVGKGYTGGKNVDVAVLGTEDNFGFSLALNAAGDRLAVGAIADDGAGNAVTNAGAVHLFSFSDTSFTGGTLQATVGKGYTGGKNVDVAALEANDLFGLSVALNATGDRLAVGARHDDGAGNVATDSGAVYLFSFSDASFTGGTLEATIGKGYTGGKNVDMAALEVGDYFGAAVALNATGDRLAVGARLDDGAGNAVSGAGAVHLFSFSDTSFTGGTLEATVGHSYTGGKNVDVATLDAGDLFGISVALNAAGDRLAVGANEDNGAGNSTSKTGAVYLFSFSDANFTGGTLQATIGSGYTGGKNVDVAALEASDYFGIAVALNATGDRLVVGTGGDDGAGNAVLGSGAVHLFSFSDTSFTGGTLQATIGRGYTGGKNVNMDGKAVEVAALGAGDLFGGAVALNAAGDRLAVGAPYDDGAGNAAADAGAVYLFSFSDTSFSGGTLQAMIGKGYTGGKNVDVAALEASDNFGSVALNAAGDRLAVTASKDDGAGNAVTDAGAVYLFSFSDANFTGGTLEATIGSGYTGGKNVDVAALEASDHFGHSVALNAAGDRLAVGARWDDGAGNAVTDAGAVYLFSFSDTNFSGGTLQATVGKGYTGGKNIDVAALEASDNFGVAVALNAAGDRLAVGASVEDGAGNAVTDAGAVTLFSFSDTNFAGGALQATIGHGYTGGKNVNVTLEASDLFGASVALNAAGDRLAVGAFLDDGAGNAVANAGAVYLFSFSDTDFTGGTLQATIGKGYTGGKNVDVATLEAGDFFGASVALNAAGDRLAVGAFQDDGAGNSMADAGAVYLFSFSDTSFAGGKLQATIGSSYTGDENVNVAALEADDRFGNAVALNAAGDRLAVGAWFDDGAGNAVSASGAVYLFSFSDTNFTGGTLQATIGRGYTGGKNVDVAALGTSDWFGASVALNAAGDRLAVGASEDDGAGNMLNNSGAVYLFSFSDANFTDGTLQATIGRGYTGGKNVDVTALEASDAFGHSVALNAAGDRLAVGARQDDGAGNAVTNAGAVYLFSFSDTSFTGGTLQATIGSGYTGGKNVDVAALEAGDLFGQSVALNAAGDRLAVGARWDDGAGNAVTDAGAVYLFSFSDTSFTGGTLQATIGSGYTGGKNVDVAALEASDTFGYGVSLNAAGDRLAVGAREDDGAGNAVAGAGAVYLFSFSDTSFTGGTLEATMGSGYTGGKNVNVVLEAGDYFGHSVALNAAGDRLAVGVYLDDGAGNAATDAGAVSLFSFSDTNFSGGALRATVGKGYTNGGKNVSVDALEASDWMGSSVALNAAGDRLAVGARQDDGAGNAVTNAGAVYLFSFSDANFAGATLQATIGSGYTGGKNVDVAALEANDLFGSAVALNAAGDRLAVGARQDDGAGNAVTDAGAVYLFNFSDTSFTGGTLQATVGRGYTGGKNVDVAALEASDLFGASVALNAAGDRLAVGAYQDDGAGNAVTNSGAVTLFSFSDTSFTGGTLQATVGKGYTGGKNVDVAALEAHDWFGASVALNAAGDRLAVGAMFDDGAGNAFFDSGAVHLFSFSDTSFTGGTLQATIGRGYTGGKNVDVTALEASDAFGEAVALNAAGDRLAVGATGDDGAGNVLSASGAVYLFGFSDTNVTGGTLQATIGKSYTGGKNIDVAALGGIDVFGNSVALNAAGDRLAVGARWDDGASNVMFDSGAVHLFIATTEAGPYSPSQTYAAFGAQDMTISAGHIAAQLRAGTAVTLQASNDIYINSAIGVTSGSGSVGALTLQAGRSIAVSAPSSTITTSGGNVTLIANDLLANGVIDAQRDAGNASMDLSSTINAGAGAVDIQLRSGAGKTNLAGNLIQLGTINASAITVNNQAPNGDASIAVGGPLTATGNISLTTSNGGISGAGDIAVGDTLSLSAPGSGALSGVISGSGSVTKAGSGTLTLSGANTYSGTTTISAGTLQVGNGGASGTLGSGNVVNNAALVFNRSADTTIGNNVSGSGTLTATIGGNLAFGGTVNLTGGSSTITATANAITLNSGSSLAANGSGNAVVLSGTQFVNNAGASALATPNGNWLVWSSNADPFNVTTGDVRGGLVNDFKQYNATYGVTAVLGSGKGFLYTLAPTITPGLTGSVSKTYDTTTAATLASANYTTGGVVDGDTVTLNNPASGSYDTKDAGTGKTVNVSGLSIVSATEGAATVYGYQLGSTSASGAVGTVTAANLTVTGVTAANKVYDATTTATLSGGSVTALGSDVISLSTGSATGAFADKNVGTGKTVTASGYTISGADAGNYTVVQPTGVSADITAKSLTVSGITVSNKVYDTTTAATLNVGSTSFGGVIGGDDVTINSGTIGGTFADKNVGTGKAINLSGVSLTGTDAGNYTLDSVGGVSADITQANLAVTGVTAANRVYDATTTATLSGGTVAALGSDVVTLATGSAAGAFADKNVGTGKTVTASGYSISGTDAGNYTLVQPTGVSADITAKSLTVSGITASNKVYDTTTAATLNVGSTSFGGVIGGDDVTINSGAIGGTFADKNAGTGKAINLSGVSLTGTDAGNYTVGSIGGVSADITQANLAVTGVTAANRVYDATTTATLSGGSVAALGSDVVSLSTASATGAFADKNVGTGKTVTASGYTISGADAGNYTVVQPTGMTADITPASLAVTGVTSTKVYDATTATPLSGATVTALGSDTVAVSSGGVTGSFADKTAGSGKSVTLSGSYTLSGTDAGNYTVVQPSGVTGTITAKPLTASGITADSKVYDGTTAATLNVGSASFGGVIGGDDVTVDSGTIGGAFADKNAGTGKAINLSGVSLSGADAGNYTLSGVGGITADITPKAVTITGITAADKAYDSTVTATLTSNGAINGLVGSETLAINASSASATFNDATAEHGKTVTATGLTLANGSGGELASNYVLTGPNPTTTAAILQINELSTGQISALAPSIIALQDPAWVAQMTDTQLGALPADSLTSTQLAALTPEQRAVVPTGGGSGGGSSPAPAPAPEPEPTIDEMTPTEIAALPPSQLSNLTSEQLSSLSEEQLSVLAPAQLAAISPAVLSGLTTTQLSALSTTQLAALPTSVLSGLTTTQLSALSTTQLAALPTSVLSGLTTTQLSALSTTQLAALPTSVLGNFTAAQLTALSPTQLVALTSSQVEMLSTAALSGLSTGQVAALSMTQVESLTPSQLAASIQSGMSVISSLTPAQLSAVQPSVMATLGSAQIADLSISQVSALLPAQLTASTSSGVSVVSMLTSSQLAAIPAYTLSSFTPSQVAALTPAQLQVTLTSANLTILQVLSPAQLVGLPATTFSQFSPALIATLSPAQIGLLNADQLSASTSSTGVSLLQALTAVQLAALPVSTVNGINAAQIAALSADDLNVVLDADLTMLQALTPGQLAALPSSTLANVDRSAIASLSPAQFAVLSTDVLANSGNFTRNAAQLDNLQSQVSGVQTEVVQAIAGGQRTMNAVRSQALLLATNDNTSSLQLNAGVDGLATLSGKVNGVGLVTVVLPDGATMLVVPDADGNVNVTGLPGSDKLPISSCSTEVGPDGAARFSCTAAGG